MRYFPLFLDLRDRPVLVVGGGAVAERKVKLLLASGAKVTVVAPQLCSPLAQRLARGQIRHRAGEFAETDLASQRWVIAATNRAVLNRQIASAAEARGLFVNVVDDAELSSAIMPALVDRSPLLIAISSGGAAPMLARHVREQLEKLLDQSLGRVAEFLGAWRSRIRARFANVRERRLLYSELLDGPVSELVRRGRPSEAAQALSARLAGPTGFPAPGRVILVGAGPGDAGLLTLRALRALNEADVVLHDRLVSPEVLSMIRRDAELLDVGKAAGGASVSQDLINRMLVTQARAGRTVVRLKGGDPFVFGRGGEELEYLRDAGISFECVPGVTAALACAAMAGIPLTHRDHARGVRFIAGHQREQMSPADWDSLAASKDTLVVYMAVAALGEFCTELRRHGRSRITPVAVIENGSRPEQRVLLGQLDNIAELAAGKAVQSPAMLVIGEVAALARTLHWFGAPPIVADPEPVAGAARALAS